MPALSGELLGDHCRRKIRAHRVVLVPHAPERQRVNLCRGSIVECRSRQLPVDFQEGAVGEMQGGSAGCTGSSSE